MKNTYGKTIAERLEHYSIPVPHCGCHIWFGGVCSRGYGVISTGGQGSTTAHRAAWEVAHGPIPQGLHVLHTCDMPACVNPDHLFLGTNRDNIDDKVRKGRAKLAGKVNRRGSSNPASVLSEAEARQISLSSVPTIELAKRFGVHRSTIFRIRAGKLWCGASSTTQAAE